MDKSKNKLLAFILSLAVCLSIAGFGEGSFVEAKSRKSPRRRNSSVVVQSSDSLTKKENQLTKQLSNIKQSLESRRKVDRLVKNNLKSLESQIEEDSKNLNGVNESLNKVSESVNVLQKSVDEKYKKIGERLLSIYKTGDVSVLGIILNVSSVNELLGKSDIMKKLNSIDKKEIEILANDLRLLSQEKSKLDDDKIKVEEINQGLSEKKRNLEENLKHSGEEVEKLNQNLKLTEAELVKIREEKRALERETSEFHSGYVKRGAGGNYSKGRYVWPVPGYPRITSPWGGRRAHKGVDISGPSIHGRAIVSAGDGVVIKTNSSNKWGQGWGYHVMVDHGNGYATQYAHCSQVMVRVGQHVKAGQQIATVGNTGHSYGAHLHFETWHNGKRYNPSTEGIG